MRNKKALESIQKGSLSTPGVLAGKVRQLLFAWQEQVWRGRRWREGEWSRLVMLFLEETGTLCPQLDSSQLAWLWGWWVFPGMWMKCISFSPEEQRHVSGAPQVLG